MDSDDRSEAEQFARRIISGPADLRFFPSHNRDCLPGIIEILRARGYRVLEMDLRDVSTFSEFMSTFRALLDLEEDITNWNAFADFLYDQRIAGGSWGVVFVLWNSRSFIVNELDEAFCLFDLLEALPAWWSDQGYVFRSLIST